MRRQFPGTQLRLSRWKALVITLLLVWARPGSAHVGLDTPKSGATLAVGSTVLVTWEDLILHEGIGYDLDLLPPSLSEPEAMTVAHGLSTNTHSYAWLIPKVNCVGCYLRVTQINRGHNYEDTAVVNIGTANASGVGGSGPAGAGAGVGGSTSASAAGKTGMPPTAAGAGGTAQASGGEGPDIGVTTEAGAPTSGGVSATTPSVSPAGGARSAVPFVGSDAGDTASLGGGLAAVPEPAATAAGCNVAHGVQQGNRAAATLLLALWLARRARRALRGPA